MWTDLSEPWQVSFELSWEAYCANTVPVGAVITGPDESIIGRGRNRILNSEAPGKQIFDSRLAHAEVNALLDLDTQLDRETLYKSTLYTTMEPCPLCMGAFYMSSLRTVNFAARDPYAGSTNLLGATPYLTRKSIAVKGPSDPILENIMVGLHTEFDLILRGEDRLADPFYDTWRQVVPIGVEYGVQLFRSGFLRRLKDSHTVAASAYDQLVKYYERVT